MSEIREDELAYIFKPKLRLQLDRKRWLDIIEMFYKQYQEKPSKELKEMMKFCGEQSQEIKTKLKNYK
jgi:hypothetical protein